MYRNVINDLKQLWRHTKGSPNVCIAVLDGAADFSHPSLQAANIQKVNSLVIDNSLSNHATHVVSTIFGQHRVGSEILGWAPECRGILIPIFSNNAKSRVSQFDLARALELAIEHGADVINISGGEIVRNVGEVDTRLKDSLQKCRNRNVLVVAAAGNDGCDCLHIPACLPNVLAVGAMDEHGQPMNFSNWGSEYLSQGILAPGRDILGAQIGGGSVHMSGTSFASPLVSAVAALLLCIQRKKGVKPSPSKVREALIKSASPCDPRWGSDCRRFLAGRLNIQAAYAYLFNGENFMSDINENSGVNSSDLGSEFLEAPGLVQQEFFAPAQATASATISASTSAAYAPGGLIASSACGCKTSSKSMVYALGKLGYDFGTEARRDGFTQLMVGEKKSPFNPQDLLDFFKTRPYESKMLIWTLNIDLTPIYAIEPLDPFAESTYAMLIGALQGQILDKEDINYIERVSIPGYLTGKTVRLYSGQIVPVISAQPRGLYMWNVNQLIKDAIAACPSDKSVDLKKLDTGLREFLDRIYYEFRNLGALSSDRALNYAATNAFQATAAFAENLNSDGKIRQLADIQVEKSPFCRLDSDCWDVKLRFFDPENDRRAARIVRYTIDVSDVMPVTIGSPRSWAATGF